MKHTKYTIIKEGQLRGEGVSAVFNPGVAIHPSNSNERHIVVRKEKTHDFDMKSEVIYIIENINKLKMGEVDQVFTLNLQGYPENSKAEDFRLFWWRGELYAIHTLIVSTDHWSRAEVIKPVIAKVTRTHLIFQDWIELPYIKKNRMEKNWLPFVLGDDLYILYGLDPLKIYKLEGFSWRLICDKDTGLAKKIKTEYPGSSMLSLSAMHQMAIMGWWHTRYKDIYIQGMFKLNTKTWEISNFTPPILSGGNLEGQHPNCLYISDVCDDLLNPILEVWAGEADSHTVMYEFKKYEILEELAQHPFKHNAPLKILINDKGVGDVICALYAIYGWIKENPKRGVKIYSNLNHEVISYFQIPDIQLWMHNGETVDIDLSSNQDHLPIHQRTTWQEKMEGSMKVWYANKLGVAPIPPPSDDSLVMEGYSDAIILFPFASVPEWGRDWSEENWLELATLLLEAGQRVVISDRFEARIKDFPGELRSDGIGATMALIKGSKLVVANESGASHMAGILNIPCLTLSGYFNPAVVNDMTNNEYIYKKPLSSITVQEVFDKVMKMLNNK